MATQRSSKQRKPDDGHEFVSEDELRLLYEPFKFLEREHWGEFLIVAADGRYVVGPNEGELLHEAVEKLGENLTILRVGEVVAGKLPWHVSL